MSANEKRPVIEVTGLKKQYKLGQIGGGTLRGDLQSWWARKRGKEDPNTLIGTDQRLIGTTFMAPERRQTSRSTRARPSASSARTARASPRC